MLVPISSWFDGVTDLLPEHRFKIDLVRRGVEELQKLGVGFQYLPEPKPQNLSRSLGLIRNVAADAFSDSACANWVKQVHRRIRDLQDALKEDGVI